MKKAKMNYKQELSKCREEKESDFCVELSDALLVKDMDTFWKSWNNKFSKRSLHAKVVEGYNDHTDIANVFKDFFCKSSVPNNAALHRSHKEQFLKDFENYSVQDDRVDIFSVCDVELALSKLKKGKAAGFDKVSIEHLINAHPCLIVSLKLLFNIMIKHGIVPDDFGNGLLIPILKGSNIDASRVENYRGITLSCVISKLFENAMLV